MSELALRTCTLYDGEIGGVHPTTTVVVRDGVIAEPLPDHDFDAESFTGEIIDAAGSPVVPGYIDIHCHGAGGVAYDEGVDAIPRILSEHGKHGTTRAVMSFVTAGVDDLEERIRAAAAVVRTNPRLLGIHPEGPFLHPEHKGAHPEHLLRDPDKASIQRLIDAAGGTLKQFTLAPEREGGIEAVRALVAAGVTASVGHTSTDFETAKEAFDAGARILTHAFNGMRGIHHRAPGPVIAALRDERVWLEVINDGIHVHPAVVKSLFTEAPERIILITDAMAATCNPDGDYMLGELEVTVEDGVARLTEGGSLAGSTLTMDQAVANAVTREDMSLDVAVAAATSHPARAIGEGEHYGRIAAGYPADILVLDSATFLPKQIFIGGEPFEG